jgi:hypothetical protein
MLAAPRPFGLVTYATTVMMTTRTAAAPVAGMMIPKRRNGPFLLPRRSAPRNRLTEDSLCARVAGPPAASSLDSSAAFGFGDNGSPFSYAALILDTEQRCHDGSPRVRKFTH